MSGEDSGRARRKCDTNNHLMGQGLFAGSALTSPLLVQVASIRPARMRDYYSQPVSRSPTTAARVWVRPRRPGAIWRHRTDIADRWSSTSPPAALTWRGTSLPTTRQPATASSTSAGRTMASSATVGQGSGLRIGPPDRRSTSRRA